MPGALDETLLEELVRLKGRVSALEAELGASGPAGDGIARAARGRRRTSGARANLPRIVLATDLDYCLCRCEGYRVYAGARPVGEVVGIRFRSRTDRPDFLEVSSGRFGQRYVLVPVSDVESVDPDRESVLLGPDRSGGAG